MMKLKTNTRGSVCLLLIVGALVATAGSASANQPINIQVDNRMLRGARVLNPFTIQHVHSEGVTGGNVVLLPALNENSSPPVTRQYELTDGSTITVRGQRVITPFRPGVRSAHVPL